MTGSGRGDRETAAEEAAADAVAAVVNPQDSAVKSFVVPIEKIAASALAAARPHLRAEVAAEIAETLRGEGYVHNCYGPRAADFIEQRFVSVRPDNEEAK